VILVDAGPFVAAASPDDRYHEVCQRFLRKPGDTLAGLDARDRRGQLLAQAGAESAAAGDRLPQVVRGWPGASAEPGAGGLRPHGRARRPVRNLDLGAADASIVALAERLGVTRIATVDRRDFTVVRPKHVPALELLPDLAP
jgi:uncharacterized protein